VFVGAGLTEAAGAILGTRGGATEHSSAGGGSDRDFR